MGRLVHPMTAHRLALGAMDSPHSALENPCTTGSALQLGNPALSPSSVLQRSDLLPSAHTHLGQQALHLLRLYLTALIFTKSFLMLGTQAECGCQDPACTYARGKVQESPSGMAGMLCGACLGAVFLFEGSGTSHPRPGAGLGTPRALKAVRGASCRGE